LIVEDNAEYAAFIDDALAAAGTSFRSTRAESLREAIAAITAGGVDVVLLDLNLPDSSGLDTLHRFQEVAGGAPIVILSGLLDQALATAAVQAGAQDYLIKSEMTALMISRVARYAVERHAAEARLHEREALYRSIIESSMDAVVIIDATGITEFNPAAEAMFGRTRAEMLGADLSALITHDGVQHLLREGARRLELTGMRADRREFPLELTLSKQPSARGPVLTAFIRDLSEQRRHENARRISEERFRLLSSATKDVIWDWNVVTNELWWSENFETVFGYSRDEVEPSLASWTTRIHPEDSARVAEILDKLLTEGESHFWAEYRYRRKSGEYAFVLDRGQVIRDEAGRAVRMVGGMSDMTEHKELERRFLRAQRMESIGTLAGGIAHDLNNMLAPVLMSIELLKDNPAAAERDQILATIETSTRRGAEMVRQVLSFARGVEGDRAPVDIAGLLKEVEKFANDTFMKNIRVRTAVNGEVSVLGDATQLHQVLINLCVNARDAMPQGGVLTLAALTEAIAQREADLDPGSAPGNYVVIRVSDTGTGIPPSIIDRLFEPFFTSKGTGKGTGLGLSTSLAIVKSHGGFIRVQSGIGKGSTFAVSLPALATRTQPAVAPSAGAPPRGSGELILVVDDEGAVLRMVTLILETFGYRVLAAENGDEAMALFAKHRDEIKVLFTDMTMPGMDGATLIRNVREVNPNLCVVAASGLGAQQAAQVKGVMRFLAKPYTATSVLKAITDAVHS
jgi:PAS domain S-box-containing protein